MCYQDAGLGLSWCRGRVFEFPEFRLAATAFNDSFAFEFGISGFKGSFRVDVLFLVGGVFRVSGFSWRGLYECLK